MASLTRWAWVWVNSGSWWWTGRPGVLRFMGSQRVRHDWATELILFRVQYNQGWQPPTTASGHELGSVKAKPGNSTSYWILFRSGTMVWLMNRERKWAGEGRESLLRGNLLPDRHSWGFPGGSAVKNLLAMQETWVWSLGQEDPQRRGWQPTPLFLPGESPWTEDPGRLQSTGSHRVQHDSVQVTNSSSRDSWPRGCPVFSHWTWLYKAVAFRAETVFWWWWDVSSQGEDPSCWGWMQRKKLSPRWHHWAAAWSLKISAWFLVLWPHQKYRCWSHHQVFCQGQMKALLWNTYSDRGTAAGVSSWWGGDAHSASAGQGRSHHVDHWPGISRKA